ncbi:hypothetical protein [Candidatus Nitrosocosmicus sp. SS]|jgi:hypothetical protein|uniref:hypothetical protein n=1 Tax=Candidatus Nitrosocosmicus agrestis TaxID=2563600 RepID=UPI00122E01FD|nr:hypothetical protein [Candidatus Nitrosocosmicus sp. SS]KAA2282121.1 hypothetical protein F1Z66_06705 [Candidatus Nitrosocosmicus sp. SS]KAF0870034.1 hypothetical protein E5N71_02105 [Candidatus Nitrosocosmicus sp. SS]MDR4492275.1 hypothetical protein [Candidatus Nitrosocosmicus sp.]
MIATENKLFEEVDKPEDSKITSEDKEKGIVERESSWTGKITGLDPFPSGNAKGQGNSKIFKNGISISNWYGIFTTAKGQEISFIGKDVSKNEKFYVLRTFFIDVKELAWMNGLVCILDGKHDLQSNSFVCSGYKLM